MIDLLGDGVWGTSRYDCQREISFCNTTWILRRHDAEVKDLVGKHVSRVEAKQTAGFCQATRSAPEAASEELFVEYGWVRRSCSLYFSISV